MSEIRSKCEGCGMCCRAIWIPLKHRDFDIEAMNQNRDREPIHYENKVSESMDDKTFIIQNWYPLTKKEALERNPQLKNWEAVDDSMLENHYYGCSQLDTENGKCRTHDNLPNVCSGYPWYGRRPEPNHQFYAEDCYYKRNVTEEALEAYDKEQEKVVEK